MEMQRKLLDSISLIVEIQSVANTTMICSNCKTALRKNKNEVSLVPQDVPDNPECSSAFVPRAAFEIAATYSTLLQSGLDVK
jgi:hypothetical protein